MKRPQQVFRDVFRFLNVDPDHDVNTEMRFNISGKPKSQWLHQFLAHGNMARRIAQPIVRSLFSPETRLRIALKIHEKNMTRMTINPQTKAKLHQFFEQDIERLEGLLKRNLSVWRK